MRIRISILIPLVCCFFVLLNGCTTTFPMLNTVSVPGATGEVKLKTDSNTNTILTIKVKHLAPPEKLMPARSVYVVWAETPEAKTMNMGQLMVDEDLEGSFTGTTPFRYFRIIITAENEPTVTTPSFEIVLSTERLKP